MNLPLLVAGGGVALLCASPGRLRRAGVPVPAYVTKAQSAAMAALPRVLGVSWSATRPHEFTERWNDVKRGLSAARGFRIVGARSYTQFSASDYDSIISALFVAVRAGVRDGGYRIGSTSAFGSSIQLGEAALDEVLAADAPRVVTLMGVEIAAPSVKFALSSLGAAVLAAELERRRVGFAVVQDHARTDAVIYRLCVEMDDAGYLITGKPPPDPRIADGVAYAAKESVKFVGRQVAKVGGGAAEIVATALLESPLVWAAGLGFVAWRVL